ncbi:MAG: thiamine phosphate synthase [Proteobacteria bacterium]|nr:thiamine phosphate synthase [Pseudomonadota bacterium]
MTEALARRKLASAAARLNARHRMAGLLPALVLFTDDERLADPLAAATALPRGAMIVVRARDAARRETLARDVIGVGRGLVVLIADDPALAAKLGADGIHLPQRRGREAAHWRALHPRWLITAAAHGAIAGDAALDALFLSNVFATASHPGRGALGARRANALAQRCPLPVYALGGIDARNARLLHGFVGLAAIGALAV